MQSECAAIACPPSSLQPPGSPPPALRRVHEPCELAFFYHHWAAGQQIITGGVGTTGAPGASAPLLFQNQ